MLLLGVLLRQGLERRNQLIHFGLKLFVIIRGAGEISALSHCLQTKRKFGGALRTEIRDRSFQGVGLVRVERTSQFNLDKSGDIMLVESPRL